jgi:hypothetical protein
MVWLKSIGSARLGAGFFFFFFDLGEHKGAGSTPVT